MITSEDILPLLSGLNVYSGTVPEKPKLPYVLLSVGVPRPLARSGASTVHGYWQRLRTTVAGFTEDSVLIVSRQVQKRLESAWVNGQMLKQDETDQPVYEDPDHVVHGVNVQYSILEWRVNQPR